MIPVYRKIFKKMAEDNKPMKYMRYAIGEILLVIIGILIAVSINGWNEDRKLKKEEQSILKDLKQEMIVNLKALEDAIDKNEQSFQAAIEMRDLFNDRGTFNEMSDSMFNTLIEKLNFNRTYDPQNGILNSIISSGKINQLSDKELKYLLASLKDLTIDALENKVQRDELMKSSWENAMIIEDDKVQGYNVKSLYDHPDFRWATNHFFYYQRKEGLEEESGLKSTLEHIIELIDQNIEK